MWLRSGYILKCCAATTARLAAPGSNGCRFYLVYFVHELTYLQVINSSYFRRCAEVPVDFAKIERLRIRAALTQSEAGARVGMSRQEWNNLIKGRYPRMSVVTLERIAAALGVTAAELLK